MLDGTENFFLSTKNDFQWFGLNLSGIKQGSSFICNILTDKISIGNYIGIANQNATNRVYLSISENINTVDELKSYLAEQYSNGTPIEIEYECEEYTEAYTEEQQKIYNKIQELCSYYGTTHITCEDETSCNFDIIYVQDHNLVRQNDKQELQTQIDEIKTLLSTSATSAMLLDNLENDLVEEV